jgi:glycosyltransferase involved in cell wall biosynthesis
MIGISEGPVCGVRDWSDQMAEALTRLGVEVGHNWLEREAGVGVTSTARRLARWTDEVVQTFQRDKPDVAVLSYSAFSYSHRGIPLFAPLMCAALRRTGVPVVCVLHEYAYPFRRHGPKGLAWALSQRAVLPVIVATSAALVFTSDRRREAAVPWRPRRPTFSLPVSSNVPVIERSSYDNRWERSAVGLFGYAYEDIPRSMIARALSIVKDSLPGLHLRLIGAPGRASEAARSWQSLADAFGIELDVTGVLEPNELSLALSATSVMLFASDEGPTSRRTTLAACLQHGKAVIATDGPATWPALRSKEAILIVPPDPTALADAIILLQTDQIERVKYEERAAEFYESTMAADIVGDSLVSMLRTVVQG